MRCSTCHREREDVVGVAGGRRCGECRARHVPECLVCRQTDQVNPVVGLCPAHYQKWLRWGRPWPTGPWASALVEGRLNTCVVCGKGFSGSRGSLYCGPECKEQGHRALRRARESTPEAKHRHCQRQCARQKRATQAKIAPKACKWCGTVFTPHRSDGIYCAPECRRASYREMQRRSKALASAGQLLRLSEQLEEREGEHG